MGAIATLPLLIILVLAALSARAVWRGVTLPRGVRATPSCGSCGYAVADLTSFTCPECGADLRQVGINTPRMEAARRGSAVWAIVSWTFLCASAGLVLTAAVLSNAVFGISSSSRPPRVAWTSTLVPKNSVYRFVELEYGTNGATLVGSIRVTLTRSDGTEHALSLDPASLRAEGLAGEAAAWDTDTLTQFYAQAGLDTGNAQVEAAAEDVSRYIDLIVMSPIGAFSASPREHTTGPPAGMSLDTVQVESPALWFIVALWLLGVVVGLTVYVFGIAFIVRRRKRLRRLPSNGRATPPPASTRNH